MRTDVHLWQYLSELFFFSNKEFYELICRTTQYTYFMFVKFSESGTSDKKMCTILYIQREYRQQWNTSHGYPSWVMISTDTNSQNVLFNPFFPQV